jgi:hypothetical protein
MPDNSFAVDYNQTQVLKIANAYKNVSFVNDWVYVGVSFAELYNPDDRMFNQSKVTVYIYGPKGDQSPEDL